MRFAVVAALGVASLVSAQASPPACFLTCFQNGVSGGGTSCGLSDLPCLCNDQAFQVATVRCFATTCAASDLAAAQAVGVNACSAVGVTLDTAAIEAQAGGGATSAGASSAASSASEEDDDSSSMMMSSTMASSSAMTMSAASSASSAASSIAAGASSAVASVTSAASGVVASATGAAAPASGASTLAMSGGLLGAAMAVVLAL